MAKIQTVGTIPQFLNGEWKKTGKDVDLKALRNVLTASGGVLAIVVPKAAFAAAMATTDSTFIHLWRAIMNVFDAGVVLVIVFAGACWCLGHRGKAMEILIGVCCGYLLARHAVDIRDFLKGI